MSNETSRRVSGDWADIPCLILAGGLGTRLRSVLADAPKPMVPVAGRPFLEYVVRWVARAGFRRVVLCTGYRADQISRYFGQGETCGVRITYSVEDAPFGTWGAIRQAGRHIDHAEFVVLNGDSWLQVDLCELVRFHRQKQGIASLAVIEHGNASRFGSIRLDADGRVLEFGEKRAQGTALINGGVYVFSRDIFAAATAATPASLENDVFPALIHCGIYGMPVKGYFIDIGVPEEYNRLVHDTEGWLEAMKVHNQGETKC